MDSFPDLKLKAAGSNSVGKPGQNLQQQYIKEKKKDGLKVQDESVTSFDFDHFKEQRCKEFVKGQTNDAARIFQLDFNGKLFK